MNHLFTRVQCTFLHVYEASCKYEVRLGEFQIVHNFGEFSQPYECLDEAM